MNIGIADFRNNMADPINRAIYAGERVVITRDGKPAVALVSIDDLRVLEELENRADLKAARKAAREIGGITLEQAKARLEKR